MPMGLDISHETLKVTSVVYKHYLRNEDLQMMFAVSRHITLIVNILFKTSIFQRMGKNNQSTVSDASREIPSLGSTDNAGNSINLVFGIIRLPSKLGFLCLHRRPMIYYKYLSMVYGVDRKICHEGHCSASRGLPSDAEQ